MVGRKAGPTREVNYTWARWNERAEIGEWLGARAARDAAYICHGEIQTGLSLDGATWVENVGARVAADIASDTVEARAREIAVARENGALIGAAIVLFAIEETPRYAVIEDLVVDSGARGAGVGGGLVAFIVRESKARGAVWAFLESGLHNERAHAFFERADYQALSKVFGKKLG